MPSQQKKFKDLKEEQKDKIFSYMSKLWEIAENLKVPSSKINNIQILMEESLMGFLPPVEFFDKIKGIFGLNPEKDKELEEGIQSKIFFDLKSELAEMYSKEELGNIDFKKEQPEEKLKEPKEKLKERPEILSNPNDLYIEKIEGETEKMSFPKKTPPAEKQKTLGEELELER